MSFREEKEFFVAEQTGIVSFKLVGKDAARLKASQLFFYMAC